MLIVLLAINMHYLLKNEYNNYKMNELIQKSVVFDLEYPVDL